MDPLTAAEKEWDDAKAARKEAEAAWRGAVRKVAYERAKARAEGLLTGPQVKWQVDDRVTVLENTPGSPLAAAVLDEETKRVLYDAAADHAETLKQVVWRLGR